MQLKTMTEANLASQAGKREPSGSASGEHDRSAGGDGPRQLPSRDSSICQHPKYPIPFSPHFLKFK